MTATPEPTFDERYLNEAFAVLDTADSRETSKDSNRAAVDDLEQHTHNITRSRLLDDCENAIANLPLNVVDFLLGVFDQICDSFLPAPLWQAPSTPSKKLKSERKDQDVVLRSLKIVSAARLALASHSSSKDQQLKVKVERLCRAASRYLDSVPQHDRLEDIEALLLLAELEYGHNQNAAARTRLENVVTALTESTRMRSGLIFGQSVVLVRRRNALRTAMMMLHWYFHEIPTPLQDLRVEPHPEDDETPASTEELFVTSQLRLASLHHRLKSFLDAQPSVDEKTWEVCEQASSAWYDDLRSQSKVLDSLTDDAPVNYFVFHQQYLTTRILLSRSHERLYKRRSGVKSLPAQRDLWTCPASAKNDAVRIASSLRNYGQKHRFREAPLSFVNHISAAADIVLSATEAASGEDDRNAYLHVSSFLLGVLKYMAEVHVRAGTLVEAVQERMNSVIQHGLTRSNSIVAPFEGTSTYSNDSHLWQWTRYNVAEEFAHGAVSSEPERPHSVIGLLQTSPQGKTRWPLARQASVPTRLSPHPEVSVEDLITPKTSYHTTREDSSTIGPEDEEEVIGNAT